MPRKNRREDVNPQRNFIRTRLKFKNESQKEAYQKIKENEICFISGPAGTAKTFLAVCSAIEEHNKGNFKKIILTRPVIEAAGEKLGHLPGELEDKIEPYIVPLFYFLNDRLGEKEVKRNIASEVFKVVPLAYMRGRTFNDSFIIADEMQNANIDQIKLLLTRIGEGSKMVLTGDPDQSDLNGKRCFGSVVEGLKGLEEVGVHQFTEEHIVRHPLIGKIIKKIDEIKNNK